MQMNQGHRIFTGVYQVGRKLLAVSWASLRCSFFRDRTGITE